MSQVPRAKLIAIGNPFWRDDAAGIAVARQVRAAAPASVEVVELGGDPASLLEAFQGAELVVIVDAVRSSAAPGSIHRIELVDGDKIPDHRPRDSSHALALGDLLALARTLDRLPSHLVLIGIEAAELGPGTGLSPTVATAVETVTRQTLRDLQAEAATMTARTTTTQPRRPRTPNGSGRLRTHT
jgi:hydrogenase maturation protease